MAKPKTTHAERFALRAIFNTQYVMTERKFEKWTIEKGENGENLMNIEHGKKR